MFLSPGDRAGRHVPRAQDLIAQFTSKGSDTAFTWTNLPQYYNHLRLIAYGAVTAAVTKVDLGLRFNGDTGNNYDVALTNNTPGTQGITTAAGNISATQPGRLPGTTSIANAVGSFDCLIPNYAGSTLQKLTQATGSYIDGSTNWVWLITAGRWRNTTPITQIDISTGSGAFSNGTTFYLYGIY